MYALQREPERGHRARFLLGAGAVTLALQGGGLMWAQQLDPPKREVSKAPITFTLANVPPPPPPAPAPAPAPEPPPPQPAATPELPPPAVAEASKPKPKPKPKKLAAKKPKRKKPEPPKPTPPPAAVAKAPKFIAGLSLSSTVAGGSGPKFGVGNTAMGTPDRVAAGDVEPIRGHAPADPERAAAAAAPAQSKRAPVRKPAKLKKKSLPRYPRDARKSGIEGVVVLFLEIDDFGQVVHAEIIKGLGYGLDESALGAARRTLWKPATLDGRPVPSKRRFNVRFTLES